LTLRGWLPASTPLTPLLEQHASPMMRVSPVLIHATTHAALLVALGKLLTGVVSPSVLELMNEMMRAPRLRKLLYLALLALLLLLSSSAVVWGMLGHHPQKQSFPVTGNSTSGGTTDPGAATNSASKASTSRHGSSTAQEP
jgi:hypothetical protein